VASDVATHGTCARLQGAIARKAPLARCQCAGAQTRQPSLPASLRYHWQYKRSPTHTWYVKRRCSRPVCSFGSFMT
jgi:hypothetical protein